MIKTGTDRPAKTSLTGVFDADEIRKLSPGPADEMAPHGAGVRMDGAFSLTPRASGVVVHTTDIAPRRSFETKFTASPGVMVTVLLKGAVFADFDGEAAHLGPPDTVAPVAEIRCFTRPVEVTRKLEAGMRTRKAAVLFPIDWLRRTGTEQRSPGFFETHKSTIRWTPSAVAIAAAETLIRSSAGDAAPTVEPDIRALAIVQEALDKVNQTDTQEAGRTSRLAAKATMARKVIDRRWREDLSLKEVASQAGMSVSALQRAFKQVFGVTVIDYRTRRRLEMAREALVRDGLTVGEAAELACYGNPTAFSAAFRREFGAPPSAFR